MKEDYLWDKTGEDKEIERLESVLSVFRYQENDAPVLSANSIAPVDEKAPRWRFSFAFAFAGAMAVAVVVLGLFWLMPRYNRELALVRPEPVVRVDETTVASETVTRKKPLLNSPLVSKTYELKPRLVRHSIPVAFKQPKVAAKATQRKVRLEDLTAEEKYAYSQLMLALSITSSKLKDVRETIDRIENDKASDKQNFK